MTFDEVQEVAERMYRKPRMKDLVEFTNRKKTDAPVVQYLKIIYHLCINIGPRAKQNDDIKLDVGDELIGEIPDGDKIEELPEEMQGQIDEWQQTPDIRSQADEMKIVDKTMEITQESQESMEIMDDMEGMEGMEGDMET